MKSGENSGLIGLLSGLFSSKAVSGTDWFANWGKTGGEVWHGGGIVGSGGRMRMVSPLEFLGAQRYHGGGLVSGEVPIIARAGEEVLTEDDPRHRNNLGKGGVNLTVNLVEAPGHGGQVEQRSQGNQVTLGILVEMIESKIGQNIGRGSSPVFDALRAVSGLSRVPGSVR